MASREDHGASRQHGDRNGDGRDSPKGGAQRRCNLTISNQLPDETETRAENGGGTATDALEAPTILPEGLAAARETEKGDDIVTGVVTMAVTVTVTATATATADADARPKKQTAVAADAETCPTMKMRNVTAARWLGNDEAPL